MENIKVLVGNTDEYNEAKHLVYELNCDDWRICQDSRGKGSKGFIECEYKQVTIDQLRDMVVLKRNSIVDATHGVVGGDRKYYLTPSSFYEYINGYWVCVDEYVNGLEFFKLNNNDLPFIDSEEEMKEYLIKGSDGNYTVELICEREAQEPHAKHWIEVPEGADTLAGDKRSNNARYFWNHKNKTIMGTGESLERYPKWEDIKSTAEQWLSEIDNNNFGILWQRNPQTESINDKVASAEEARQKQPNKKTIDVMDGVKLMESLARFNNTDRGADFDNFELFEKHSHYKKDVSHLEFIDVYRVLDLFEVESHAVGHAIKKLLCSGQRGAKDKAQDIQESIDSLNRELDMMREDKNNG